MVALSALSTATTTATSLSNLVLVSPNLTIGYQPMNPPNPDGSPSNARLPPSFVFQYEGEQSVTLDAEITDHFVEDNRAVQDQIALKPVMVTTQGFIGELNDVVPTLLQLPYQAAQKLSTIVAYAPALTIAAQLAYNQAFQLYQVTQNAINSAVSAWSTVSGGQGISVITGQSGFPLIAEPNQNKQQTAFQQFYGWYVNRILFTIQTPWAIFQNMAIKTLKSIQGAESRVFSTFECTFKQIRTASTSLQPAQSNKSQGRLSSQSSSLTNQGVSKPPVSTSLSTGLSQSYPGMFA